MEAEMAKVYTRKLFLIFQEELFCSKKYRASKDREEGVKKIYKVLPHGKERPIYEVSLENTEKKAICRCHMFEFIGILCRHILTVFVKKSLVDFLPVDRWLELEHRLHISIATRDKTHEVCCFGIIVSRNCNVRFDLNLFY
jgi:hypothetical protein